MALLVAAHGGFGLLTNMIIDGSNLQLGLRPGGSNLALSSLDVPRLHERLDVMVRMLNADGPVLSTTAIFDGGAFDGVHAGSSWECDAETPDAAPVNVRFTDVRVSADDAVVALAQEIGSEADSPRAELVTTGLARSVLEQTLPEPRPVFAVTLLKSAMGKGKRSKREAFLRTVGLTKMGDTVHLPVYEELQQKRALDLMRGLHSLERGIVRIEQLTTPSAIIVTDDRGLRRVRVRCRGPSRSPAASLYATRTHRSPIDLRRLLTYHSAASRSPTHHSSCGANSGRIGCCALTSRDWARSNRIETLRQERKNATLARAGGGEGHATLVSGADLLGGGVEVHWGPLRRLRACRSRAAPARRGRVASRFPACLSCELRHAVLSRARRTRGRESGGRNRLGHASFFFVHPKVGLCLFFPQIRFVKCARTATGYSRRATALCGCAPLERGPDPPLRSCAEAMAEAYWKEGFDKFAVHPWWPVVTAVGPHLTGKRLRAE